MRDPAARSNARTAGRDATHSVGGASPHEHDDELGLVNMNGRLYDPRLRRVLTPDPLVSAPTADGWNPYAYALNSPTAFVDPSGYSAIPGPGASSGCGVEEPCFEVGDPQPGPDRASAGSSGNNSGGAADAASGTAEAASGASDGPAVAEAAATEHQPEVSDGNRTQQAGVGPTAARPGVSTGADSRGAAEAAKTALTVARHAASIGVGFVPILGSVQSAVELVSGRDYITGQQTSRTLAAAGLFAGIFGLKGLVKGAALGAKAAKAARGAGALRVASGSGETAAANITREIQHGEKITDILAEGKALTFASGNEHALVSLTNGRRVIVSGGPGGIDLSGLSVRRLLGHTHPYHVPPTGPSAADMAALQTLGQRNSYILEHGVLIRFGAH